MADYGYSQPFSGFQQGIPAGYLEAATAPGRNIASGIASAGASIGAALEKYRDRKDQGDFAQQTIENSIGEAWGAIQNGNIMDPNTHESKLMKTIMGITKTKDPEKLLAFATETPGMSLGKRKALAHDLQYGLKRYYDAKDNESMAAYREAITQQVRAETQANQNLLPLRTQAAQLANQGAAIENQFKPLASQADIAKANALTAQTQLATNLTQADVEAQKAMLGVPLETEATREVYNPDQIVSVYEDGKLVAGPGDKLAGDTPWDVRQELVKGKKTYSQAFADIAKVFAEKGTNIPQEKIHEYLSTQGVSPEPPAGMVQTSATRKTLGGVDEFRNVDAETEAAVLVANAKNRGNPLNENQARAVVYARAMTANEDVLKGMEKGDFTGTGTWDKFPNLELWKKDPRKIFESSKYAWIDALARFRSGAGVRPDEYDNYDKTFMPQPGDDRKAIEHKRKLRESEFKSLQLVAGPSAVGMIGGADDGKKRFKFNPVTGQLE